MSFTPPSNSRNAAIRPDEGWYSCGWRLLESWLAKRERTYAQLGEAVGCSKGLISGWKNGRPVNAPFLARLEQLCGIPPEAWTWWTQDEPLEAHERPSSPPPESAPRVRRLGTTTEELWETVRGIDEDLRGEVTVSQRTVLRKARAAALTSISRLEKRQAIHEHPDADGFLEDVVQAVYDVLGPDAPEGIGSQIAARLLELQTKRADAPREAAA